jgi:hypothetical protein
MFYVSSHEVGHSLGLNHISDRISIKNDTFNFTYESINEQLIKTIYSNHYSLTPRKATETITSTSTKILLLTEPTTSTVTQTESTRNNYSTQKQELKIIIPLYINYSCSS